jgi:hypothetical protein
MFPAGYYDSDWLTKHAKELGGCRPELLERCVYALTLLRHLSATGLPFVFKGGTSLLLHLNPIRRLSIDIDIVCGAPAGEVTRAAGEIGRLAPFLRSEEDARGVRDLPQRRHFKFYFRSALGARAELPVLLDVVEEARQVHATRQQAIRTPFLVPDREVLVTVSTVESLLGDKLTAFAPTTTGVPLRKPDGSAADVMQVVKQLFDVGVLFEAAGDFAQVGHSYDAICALESGYRAARPSREAALDDTLKACLALTATKASVLASYPDARLLHDGFNRLAGHLTWAGFGREHRRTLAARAAVLAAHLRSGQAFDFAAARYTGSPAQIDTLRAASFNGTPYAWLDGLKAVNPEAFHYWLAATPLL